MDKNRSKSLSVESICDALDVCPRTYYRSKEIKVKKEPRTSHRALGPLERYVILLVLVSEDFVDKTPKQVFYSLLDRDLYLCSVSLMYDVLRSCKAVKERRNQRRHPKYEKPVLKATAPNQVWSWDITKVKGPRKYEYYHLYVIIDIYSRMVVGWTIETVESELLATNLIRETCDRQGIRHDQLSIHADRGSAMRSKTVAQLMNDLGVVKSHSRPRVSNDNPFSEAQFKTLKYHPSYPERFGSLQDARAHMRTFFDWYNNEHYHSGIEMHTPASVHHGWAKDVCQKRKATMDKFIQNNPNRFVKGKNSIKYVSTEVWINQPSQKTVEAA